MEKMKWIVDERAAGMRLDVYLSQNIEDLSRSAAAHAIEEKAVSIEGKRAKAGYQLKISDQIEYTPLAIKPAQAQPQQLDLEVIYQDDDLAIINKPVGMVTHPSAGHDDGTLVNALLYHLNNLSGIGGQQRPGIIHRLDKDTSGLLVVAKNDRSHHALSESLQNRTLHRYYHAIVWGTVESPTQTIETYLGRDPKNRKRFAVVGSKGKYAKTTYTVIEKSDVFSWLYLKLDTGRTHQIRIHCHHIDCPIVGDRLYGKRAEATQLHRIGQKRPPRQLLHARQLEFDHPKTGKKMKFQAEWPKDFRDFGEAIGFEVTANKKY